MDDLAVRSKSLAAGGEHGDAVGVADDPIDDAGDRVQEVLAVVDHEQQTTFGQTADELVDQLIARTPRDGVGDADGCRDGAFDLTRPAQRTEVAEADAVGVLRGQTARELEA